MNDDDFNKLFGDGDPPDPMAWVIMVLGIAAVLFTIWLSGMAKAEDCGITCTGTAWKLELDGNLVEDDLTEEECDELAEAIEPQTRPFRSLKCIEYEVSRQDI